MKLIYESEKPRFAILRDERQFIGAFSFVKDTRAHCEDAEGTFVRFMKDGSRWKPEVYFTSLYELVLDIMDRLTYKTFKDNSGFQGYIEAQDRAYTHIKSMLKVLDRKLFE